MNKGNLIRKSKGRKDLLEIMELANLFIPKNQVVQVVSLKGFWVKIGDWDIELCNIDVLSVDVPVSSSEDCAIENAYKALKIKVKF